MFGLGTTRINYHLVILLSRCLAATKSRKPKLDIAKHRRIGKGIARLPLKAIQEIVRLKHRKPQTEE